MIRKVEDISYILTYKRVKNINLRIDREGNVCVSMGKRVPVDVADSFVLSKRDWIKNALKRTENRKNLKNIADKVDNKTSLEHFSEISHKVYEILKNEVNFEPEIKVKSLKSAWGICHPKKGYITLNKALIMRTEKEIFYVIMHEYIHFLYADHQKGFYKKLGEYLPEYKEYEKMLKSESVKYE